jgi:Integrase core domain
VTDGPCSCVGWRVPVTERKRAGISSVPPIEADAPNVVWAVDFQFDSTTDGKAIKIASMIDEHTRVSLLNLVERSITGEHLVDELKRVFAANGGPPKCCAWTTARKWFPKCCNGSAITSPGWSTSRRAALDNGYIESFNNRLRTECLNRNHWEHPVEARLVIGDVKDGHNPRDLALSYRTPGRVRCGVKVHPHPGGLRHHLRTDKTNPTLKLGGLSNGDSPHLGNFDERDHWLAPSPSPSGPAVPVRHDEHGVDTFIWPPVGLLHGHGQTGHYDYNVHP